MSSTDNKRVRFDDQPSAGSDPFKPDISSASSSSSVRANALPGHSLNPEYSNAAAMWKMLNARPTQPKTVQSADKPDISPSSVASWWKHHASALPTPTSVNSSSDPSSNRTPIPKPTQTSTSTVPSTFPSSHTPPSSSSQPSSSKAITQLRKEGPTRSVPSPSPIVSHPRRKDEAIEIVSYHHKTPLRQLPQLDIDGLEIIESSPKSRPIAPLPRRAKRSFPSPVLQNANVPDEKDTTGIEQTVKREEMEDDLQISKSSHPAETVDLPKMTANVPPPPSRCPGPSSNTAAFPSAPRSSISINDSDGYYHTEPQFGPRRSTVPLQGASHTEDWVFGRHWHHRDQVNQDRRSAANWAEISPFFLFDVGELREMHNYLASRYRFQTTEQYQHLLATFRNQHANDAMQALHRYEELHDILDLVRDCRDDLGDLRRDLRRKPKRNKMRE